MFRNLFFVSLPLVLGLALAACQSDPGDTRQSLIRPVDPRIETCSAGSTVTLSAKAKADLSDLLRSGNGEMTIETEREVRTILTDNAGGALTGDDLVRALDTYTACLRDEADRQARREAPWKFLTAAECSAAYACEAQNMAQYRTCQEVVYEMYTEGSIGKSHAQTALRDCNGMLAENSACYQAGPGAQLKTSRALCSQKIGPITDHVAGGGEEYRRLFESMKSSGLI
jgi:hypothetical protein